MTTACVRGFVFWNVEDDNSKFERISLSTSIIFSAQPADDIPANRVRRILTKPVVVPNAQPGSSNNENDQQPTFTRTVFCQMDILCHFSDGSKGWKEAARLSMMIMMMMTTATTLMMTMKKTACNDDDDDDDNDGDGDDDGDDDDDDDDDYYYYYHYIYFYYYYYNYCCYCYDYCYYYNSNYCFYYNYYYNYY